MKVTQEKLPASQVGLEIEITPEITQQKYEQVIRNLSKTVNIPGFRKGKVPRQVLIQRIGDTRVKATALEEIIQEGIEQAIKQEAITAIGQPQLRSSFDDLIINYKPGQPLIFAAAVDVIPEVQLNQYTGLTAKAEEIKYDPTQVDTVIEAQREKLATLVPVEGRAAQIGDMAVIDFKGVIAKSEGDDPDSEPKPIPGGEGTDFQVELQEDKFIPGFVLGIVGMNPGETKEVSAQFPDPYGNEELSGKLALFTITLKEIKAKELPELDDDFAQEVSDFETLDQLRASLEERYQKEAADKTKTNQQEALATELLNHVEIDLPTTFIDQEIDSMLSQTAMKLSEQGIDVKKLFTQEIIPQLRDRSKPEAIERLKRSLSLQEIGKRESIEVAAEAVQARVAELMAEYSDQDLDEVRLRGVVKEELLTQKIFDWLLERSSVELVAAGSLTPTEEPDSEVESIEAVQEEATSNG
ncbi:trigger factor [Dolichospermum sp. ST_con]|nr:trigger factor [Dolichospermum sp. ST_con]MDD1420732.1 trigger factor [Dolichospermum sp. ST_sed1]MDD1423272.1 trigger factor [Dolichospermum sp. ST_sed9]MDD1432423.1 trigger factor [Dolichospermum sp. ST_sed6]MDD1440445.1 trigger factor [Dolichospermum sp. ST_sed3]MDD1448331.1 trigger factor [Dolichospermum sp. ST_sed8]MDD1454707.1 trigger factor [Dolichospermum sp. ST_sed7]MDD1459519.1 trigger factor [Dolichospermum sp. ST_sed2]MDD1468392.1 trigger factor [Dolichospermum sp. ST_sed5]M